MSIFEIALVVFFGLYAIFWVAYKVLDILYKKGSNERLDER